MLKAMYGCVQASLLWHRLLVRVLKDIGFQQSEVDPCVMRMSDGLIVSIIMIYVDDLLLFAPKRVVDMVLKRLKDEFQWLTVEHGVMTMSYLGMQLVFGTDEIVIDMVFYLENVLKDMKGLVRQSLPGTRNVFLVDKDLVLLEVEEASVFFTRLLLSYIIL
jgi:hydrogenase maturation factor HypE